MTKTEPRPNRTRQPTKVDNNLIQTQNIILIFSRQVVSSWNRKAPWQLLVLAAEATAVRHPLSLLSFGWWLRVDWRVLVGAVKFFCRFCVYFFVILDRVSKLALLFLRPFYMVPVNFVLWFTLFRMIIVFVDRLLASLHLQRLVPPSIFWSVSRLVVDPALLVSGRFLGAARLLPWCRSTVGDESERLIGLFLSVSYIVPLFVWIDFWWFDYRFSTRLALHSFSFHGFHAFALWLMLFWLMVVLLMHCRFIFMFPSSPWNGRFLDSAVARLILLLSFFVAPSGLLIFLALLLWCLFFAHRDWFVDTWFISFSCCHSIVPVCFIAPRFCPVCFIGAVLRSWLLICCCLLPCFYSSFDPVACCLNAPHKIIVQYC